MPGSEEVRAIAGNSLSAQMGVKERAPRDVSDVNCDDDNAGLSGRKVAPAKILEGQVTANKASKLKGALPS